MKPRLKTWLLAIGACAALALIIFIGAYGPEAISYLFAPYPAIPFQKMDVEERDVAGVATIKTPYFNLAFEGESFHPSASGGGYTIDGRHFNFPPNKVGPESPLE